MNRKWLPAVAAFLILAILLGSTPMTYAVTRFTIGPNLVVVTIPQDDQKREKGIMILGLDTTHTQKDLLSQHKIIVTYNGVPLVWAVGTAGVTVKCNVLEKDKVNVVPDPKTEKGKQGDWENLMTKLVDVTSNFECKVRWKHPGNSLATLESVGVLDVYFKGTATKYFIADHILVVSAYITVGRTLVWGVEMQDICVLGWGMNSAGAAQAPEYQVTKPDGKLHYIWKNALGPFAGCEDAAIYQRAYVLGVNFETATDPLAPK